MYQVVRNINENTLEGFHIFEDIKMAQDEAKFIKALLGYDTYIIEV